MVDGVVTGFTPAWSSVDGADCGCGRAVDRTAGGRIELDIAAGGELAHDRADCGGVRAGTETGNILGGTDIWEEGHMALHVLCFNFEHL